MVVLVDTVSVNQVRPRHPEKVNRPDALSPPKPDWIRVRAPNTRGYADTRKIVKENGLVTVCEEAGCPNIGECWDKKHATFMIMGDTCTRACAFCNVKTGMPGALDAAEPEHVAEATFKLGLAHIVVTLGRSRRSRRRRRRAFRADDPRHPRALPDHDHRNPHPRLPAQGRRAGGGRSRQARRVQPQSGNRAVAVSHGAPGRALFPFDPAAAAGQGNRSDHLHQIRHHGRPRRGAARGAAGDGRSALGRGRFPDHRAISAADPQASRRHALRDPG